MYIMKRVLFGFAIMAAAATMASCGNKTAQNNEGQDSATTEAPIAEVATSAIAETIDKAGYTIGLPEGWAVMSADDEECFIYKGDKAKPSEAISGTWIVLKRGSLEGKTFDAAVQEMIKETGAKLLDDVIIGGRTYKHCSCIEDGVESRILVTVDDKGVLSFMMGRTTPDDADVQAIISSLKVK